MRVCKPCGVEKELEEFHRSSHFPLGRAYTCKECRKGHRSPEQQRRDNLKHNYGITPEDVEHMLAQQDGKCAICWTEVPGGRHNTFHVDHDHVTKKVRGLLCHHCNLLLGNAKDNIETLTSAINYLEKA